MSNRFKIKNPPKIIDPDQNLTQEQLQQVLKQRPQHPDFETISAAIRWLDATVDDKDKTDEIIKNFCDPSSLFYISVQRAMRSTDDPELVKTLAAGYIDGFLAACACQDRAVIDLNDSDYVEYERDEALRQVQFEQFRRQSSDIFEFRVDRHKDDDRSFSKGSLEWLHDLLWMFLAARISAHWDREGHPCKAVKINVQVDTE